MKYFAIIDPSSRGSVALRYYYQAAAEIDENLLSDL